MFEIPFTANGEVIVTLLPVNEKLPWLMPAKFRPELVPEELMAPVLTVSIWLGVIAEWFFYPIKFIQQQIFTPI